MSTLCLHAAHSPICNLHRMLADVRLQMELHVHHVVERPHIQQQTQVNY